MNEEPNQNKEKDPQYWNLLSESDKAGYNNLRRSFNAGSIRRNRGHRIETFDGILEAIRKYAERKAQDDWKRFLVCGVCWMDQAIAINTRQLRLLISKCKSSINGSLLKLGYSTNTSHSESWKILFSRIPLLKDNFTEIRQWTIRYKDVNAQQQQTDKDVISSLRSLKKLQTTVGVANNDPVIQQKEPEQSANNGPIVMSSQNVQNILKDDTTKPANLQICPLKFRAKFSNQYKDES